MKAMASKIQGRIMDAAIELFANYGYFGATTRDLAKKSRVTEGSIYRLFRSKERLFEDAVQAVHETSLKPEQMLLMVFDKPAKQTFAALTESLLQRWYFSISRPGARLLMQAYFADQKWKQIAYGPIAKVIEVLASVIAKEQPRSRKFDSALAIKALIMTLLQFKTTYAAECSQKEEAATVDALIQHWFEGLHLDA
jgi:AcrR family transcriptional regulator